MKKTITLEARLENLPKVLAFIDEELERADAPVKIQMQLDIAVEELFVNVASYAYPENDGQVMISMLTHEETTPHRVEISLTDSGIPFNPLERKDPDVTLSAEERGIGGLGIYMVKQSMSNVSYEYKNGQNILTIFRDLE